MENYLVTFRGIGDSTQSVNVRADKVYMGDNAATFYRVGKVVAAFSLTHFIRFVIQGQ